MSSRAKGKVPKYQNTFAFRHNPNSQKTKVIMAIPACIGLCERCTAIIEWKRRYRKYKPLSRPRKCTGCAQSSVKLAYHVLCGSCASQRGVCAKCGKDRAEQEAIAQELETLNQQITLLRDTKGHLPGISERERRSMLRECLRERQGLMDGEGGEEDEGLGLAGEGAEGEEGTEEGAAAAAEAARKKAADGAARRQARLAAGAGEEDEDEDEEDEEEEDDEEDEEEEEEAAPPPSKAAPPKQPARAAAPSSAEPGYESGLVDPAFFVKALEQAKGKQAMAEGARSGQASASSTSGARR